jgi:hypothetical protein
LKDKVCANSSCWESTDFTEAGVRVVLGNGWCCLMADRHFSNTHGCVARRQGGYCDGIAAFRQSSNRNLRIIEAKAGADIAKARPQLRRGAELVLGLFGGDVRRMTAECHASSAPRITARPRRDLKVGTTRIPIELWVAGVRRWP